MRGRGTLASQRQRDEDEARPCPALWATGSGSSSRNCGVPVRSGQEPRPDQALAWPAPQGRQVHPAPPDVDRGTCVHEEKHQRGGCSLPTALCAPGHSRALRRGVRQTSSHTHSLGWAWMGQGPPATPQGLLPAGHGQWLGGLSSAACRGGLALGHLHPRSPPASGRGLHCQLGSACQRMISPQQRTSL